MTKHHSKYEIHLLDLVECKIQLFPQRGHHDGHFVTGFCWDNLTKLGCFKGDQSMFGVIAKLNILINCIMVSIELPATS